MGHATADADRAWRRLWGLALLMALGAAFAYLPVIDFSFIADDDVYLGVKNNRLLNLQWSELHQLLRGPMNPWEFLPVRDLSYWIDSALFGVFADGYHFSNLLWYALTCAVLYWCLYQALTLMGDSSERAAALAMVGMAVFAVHPAHVEPVAWISGRKDLMAGFFSLLAWGALLKAVARGWSIPWLGLSVFAYACACFSKSVAVTTGVILVLSVVALRPTGRSALGAAGFSALVITLTFLAMITHIEYGRLLGIQIDNDPGPVARLERSSRILYSLLEMIFFPQDLRLIHDIYAAGSWHWWISFAALCVLCWAVWRVARQQEGLAAGVLAAMWSIVPLVAYLQVIPFSTWSMASERFVFLATAGLSFLVVAALRPLNAKCSILLLLAVGAGAFPLLLARIPDWELEASVFSQQAKQAPGHAGSVRYMAFELSNRGELAEAMQLVARVEREDARKILLELVQLVAVEQRLRASSLPEPFEDYCRRRMLLVHHLDSEVKKIRTEPDLTYSSFLGNVQAHVNPGNKLRKRCGINRTAEN
jgi:hypothetical protein